MRTTLTIDDDLAMALHAKSRAENRPFKAVVNEALRRGLEASGQERPRITFRVYDTGMDPDLDLTKATQIAAAMEDDHILAVMADFNARNTT